MNNVLCSIRRKKGLSTNDTPLPAIGGTQRRGVKILMSPHQEQTFKEKGPSSQNSSMDD